LLGHNAVGYAGFAQQVTANADIFAAYLPLVIEAGGGRRCLPDAKEQEETDQEKKDTRHRQDIFDHIAPQKSYTCGRKGARTEEAEKAGLPFHLYGVTLPQRINQL
jgi:hypothetical protein